MTKRAAMALLSLLLGCSGDSAEHDPADGPPGDPDLACPEDPDCFSTDSCQAGCPDYWVCTDTDEGTKRCWNPEPFPGDGSWTCIDAQGTTLCEGDHLPEGGGGWACEQEGEHVVCTRGATHPDEGSGTGWDCSIAGEFRVCDETGAPDDEGGGPFDCALTAEGLVECAGGADRPDGGEGLCWVADPGAGAELGQGLGTVVYGDAVEGQFQGVPAVYVRFAFTTAFVDNTYGVHASEGWDRHTFRDLVGSDKATIQMSDTAGNVALEFVVDYVSESEDAPSGYRSLGVTGGEGEMVVGDASAVLHATTSLDRNLNQRGCVFTVDSPTEEECPAWDEQVVYEAFVRADVFGAAGVGSPAIGEVHASPSKLGENTLPVVPADCP